MTEIMLISNRKVRGEPCGGSTRRAINKNRDALYLGFAADCLWIILLFSVHPGWRIQQVCGCTPLARASTFLLNKICFACSKHYFTHVTNTQRKNVETNQPLLKRTFPKIDFLAFLFRFGSSGIEWQRKRSRSYEDFKKSKIKRNPWLYVKNQVIAKLRRDSIFCNWSICLFTNIMATFFSPFAIKRFDRIEDNEVTSLFTFLHLIPNYGQIPNPLQSFVFFLPQNLTSSPTFLCKTLSIIARNMGVFPHKIFGGDE